MSAACQSFEMFLRCRSHALGVSVTQARWRCRQETVVLFAKLTFLPQRLFPTLFQRSRHQAVLWFDALILPFGALRLVLGTFQPLPPVPMKTLAFPLDARRRLQTQVHGSRLQGAEHLLGNQFVYRRGFQAKARLLALLEKMSVAPVVGFLRPFRLIANVQAMPIAAANDQAAEQCPPCASRALRARKRAVLAETPLVRQIPFPTDTGRHATLNQDADFAGGQEPLAAFDLTGKGSQLRRAGMPDWRSSLLQMALPDPRLACVVALQHDPALKSEQERVEHFVTATACSRATYFRMRARLANALSLERGG